MPAVLHRFVLVSLLLLNMACESRRIGGGSPDCVRGASQACACEDGRSGSQVCEEGLRYAACRCTAPDAEAELGTDAGPTDALGGHSTDVDLGEADAPSADAAIEADGAEADAAEPDAGADASTGADARADAGDASWRTDAGADAADASWRTDVGADAGAGDAAAGPDAAADAGPRSDGGSISLDAGRYIVVESDQLIRDVKLYSYTPGTPPTRIALPNLSNAVTIFASFAWHPDGALLAIREFPSSICIYEFASGSCIDHVSGSSAEWSRVPRGTLFAISTTGCLYISDASTGVSDCVAPGNSSGLSWSPTEAALLYRIQQTLWLWRQGSSPQQLDSGVLKQAWLADGSGAAVLRNRAGSNNICDIVREPLAGNPSVMVDGAECLASLALSGDGARLAFSNIDANGYTNIFIEPLSSFSSPRPATSFTPLRASTLALPKDVELSFTPDSAYVVSAEHDALHFTAPNGISTQEEIGNEDPRYQVRP